MITNLKNGDTLLCKMDCDWLFDKGKWYKIVNYETHSTIGVYCSKVVKRIFKLTQENHLSNEYLWKYFYTPQEIRKEKLKTLKNINL